MAKWRVWNKHPDGLTHQEKFKDVMIKIPAQQYVLMDYEDAVQFKGQFTPFKKDAQDAPDRKCFKVIFIEPHDGQVAETEAQKEFICNRDGAKFLSQEELDKHIKANYADEVFKDEALDQEIEKTRTQRKGKSA